MDAELQRAHALLALFRRLHAGVPGIMTARTLAEVDAKLVEMLPGASGFERVALLTLPTMQEASQVAYARAGTAPDLRSIPPGSPLAPGGFLHGRVSGTAGERAPH